MSSKLDELREQHSELVSKMYEIETELKEQERKELLNENRPLRYDSETGEFTARIPKPETDTGFTDYKITLSEDHLIDLLKEIPEANYSLTSLFATIGTEEPLVGGLRKGPTNPYNESHPLYRHGTATFDDSLQAAINNDDEEFDGEVIDLTALVKGLFSNLKKVS